MITEPMRPSFTNLPLMLAVSLLLSIPGWVLIILAVRAVA